MSSSRTKQPNEEKVYTMDFTNLLDGATIASVDSVGQLKWDKTTKDYIASTDLTFGAPSDDGANLAQVRIEGGVDKTIYKVTMLVTDNLTQVHEGDGILSVVDQ